MFQDYVGQHPYNLRPVLPLLGGWNGNLRQLRGLRPPVAGIHLKIRRDRAVLRGR